MTVTGGHGEEALDYEEIPPGVSFYRHLVFAACPQDPKAWWEHLINPTPAFRG